MGLLDGGLQRVAFGAFGSLLLPGVMQQKTPAQTRDAKGRIVQGDTPDPKACRAFYDTVTDVMRANGYQNRDVQIICLQLSPDGSQIPEPVEGDEITITRAGVDSTWRIALPIAQDPAAAAWTFRGTPT